MAEASKGVVFDLAVSSRESWKILLGHIQNLRNALGRDVPVEVVAYNEGTAFLTDGDPELRSRIDAFSSQGVVFYAAKTCLIKRGVDEGDLNPDARVADSAVAELARRQLEGWAYIKISHY